MEIINFADIWGMESAKAEIFTSFAARRLNHAYLLEGGAGCGKFTFAQVFAMRYLCHNPQGENPCGQCRSCQMLREGNHPDFLSLPRSGRGLPIARFVERPNSESGDEVPVLSFMRYKPLLEHGRVCIIPEAERMDEAAANAFLKTLEEPPENSLLILTTNSRERIIGTILSRCRRIIIRPLDNRQMQTALRQQLSRRAENSPATDGAENSPEPSPANLAIIAQMAEGSLGRGISLLDGDTLQDWQNLSAGWRHFTPADAVTWAENIIEELTDCKTPDEKRSRLLYWLDMAAIKVRRLLRNGNISALGGSDALAALWKAGERLNANVRPELVALTAALATFAAIRGTENS